MATNTTKTVRRPRNRRAVRQHISDRRYYVQCTYRVIMAIISLTALFAIMGK